MPKASEEFSRLFHERFRTIYRYILQRVDDVDLAEDLASETFGLAWKKFRGDTRITVPWLLATARNLIGNEYQRRTRDRARTRRMLLEELEQLGALDGSYEEVEIRLAMTKLREVDALALQLTYWDGLTAREAAEVLGCSTPAFWTRLTRARRALRPLLAEAPHLVRKLEEGSEHG